MVNFGKGLTITTSWDDGHPMDLRVAELLTRYGLPGTFYVPLSNSRPTLSTAEIRGLSQQFEIGAHTVNHVRLTALADSEAQEQVTDSKKQLEDILGKPCSIFCFPGGSLDARGAISVTERAAYIGGVFHLCGHSWEIEENGQWRVLDETLAAISKYSKCASLLTNTELCSDVGKTANNPKPALVS